MLRILKFEKIYVLNLERIYILKNWNKSRL